MPGDFLTAKQLFPVRVLWIADAKGKNGVGQAAVRCWIGSHAHEYRPVIAPLDNPRFTFQHGTTL